MNRQILNTLSKIAAKNIKLAALTLTNFMVDRYTDVPQHRRCGVHIPIQSQSFLENFDT